MKIQRFVEELQRRHVFRVACGYLVASWFAVEVSSTVLPLMGHSEEGAVWVLWVAIAGVPLMLLLAWLFDITKDGIIRTPPRPTPDAATGVAAPQPAGTIVLSSGATGMFGLGVLVAIVSLAAYSSTQVPEKAARVAAADSAATSIRSIAVMTFVDISEAQDQEYFADGMTEELLNRLSQLQDLRVVSGRRHASSRNGDISQVADALNVQAVLEGSVRRSRDSVRVAVNIIDAHTDAVLFSRIFTRSVANVFQVQDEIAAAVASALQLQRASGLADAAGRSGTTNSQAADLYARGTNHLRERTDAHLREALKYFQAAIELDPQFAAAHAALAQTYAVLPTVGSFDFEEAGTLGTLAAGRAIALDPSLGQASAALGQIMQNLGWDPASAAIQYERAIQFVPGDATAHQWYAETLTMLGRTDEALEHINIALERSGGAPAARNTLGYLLTIRGDTDEALKVFRTAAALYPEYRLGHLTHALTALTASRHTEAEAAAVAYAGGDAALATALTTVIRGAAGTGSRADAVAAAASLEKNMGPGFAALWLAALGDNTRAMLMVRRAFDQHRDANFPYFVIHPLLRPLHANPDYRRIVTAMGVTPAG